MNKKILIPFFILLIAILALIMKFTIKEPIQQKNSLTNASVTITPTIKIPSDILKEYSDPSGFTFSYPEDIEIKNQETDSAAYSSLILTSPVATGSVNILVSDTKYKSIEAWQKNNQELTSGLEIQDAALGNLTGISFGSEDKLTQIVLDQGIEFKIEVDFETERNYWENVYNALISSFSFVSNATNTSNTSTDSDVIFEGEEVVE